MSKALTKTKRKAELSDLLKRTNKEDPSQADVAALCRALNEDPRFWKEYGDFARLTQNQIVDSISASTAVKESM